LRGLKTMAVRLKAVEKSALSLAQWLSARPEVELVLHPALDSCPGHDLWKRDFIGSSGLFSIVMHKGLSRDRILRFIDDLELFQVGWSWGGVASLAVSYDLGHRDYGGRLVRLNIGLEDVEDLRADLERGLTTLSEE
jgi:cystathionine beta-lyase